MLSIYTEHITNRLTYITSTLFGDDVVMMNDINVFNNSTGKKINYSAHENIACDLWVSPVNLLFETTISFQKIECFNWHNNSVFFKTSGSIPFDILAASFYLLTRYEEYSSDYKKDEFGNYHYENSLAWKQNFLNLPLVNFWIKEIEKEFGIKSRDSKFKIIPTYDIDIAYAYKNHSLYVQLGGLIKDLILQRGTFNERLQVLLGYKKDPYNIFNWLNELHSKYHLIPIYFILLAQQRSAYDKNSSASNSNFVQLIKTIAKQNFIGIHPSYKSNFKSEILKTEIEKLQRIINKQVTKSRQHFLQLHFPNTYQTIIEKGIQEDYTMGYGTKNGFRASYCYPFYWFDLINDHQTKLLLRPFCYMDANCIFEQHLSAEEALQEMKYYYEQVKFVHGEFSFIMHNHFLAEQPKWKAWRKTYQEFLAFISSSSSI